jgi:hypothetical protein
MFQSNLSPPSSRFNIKQNENPASIDFNWNAGRYVQKDRIPHSYCENINVELEI